MVIDLKKASKLFYGIIIGIINVALGAGGGIIAVPILKKTGMSQKEAQANTIALIFPITIISLIIYFKRGYVNFIDMKNIFPASIGGALVGTVVLSKISNKVLSIIFSLFMIWAGLRLLLK